MTSLVLTYIHSIHGDIDPKKLQQQENIVQAMIYDPTEAPDCVYQAINDLMTMGAAGHAPYTPSQAVNMAYIILSRTGKFGNSLREWICKPQQDITWVNFKAHLLQLTRN